MKRYRLFTVLNVILILILLGISVTIRYNILQVNQDIKKQNSKLLDKVIELQDNTDNLVDRIVEVEQELADVQAQMPQ